MQFGDIGDFVCNEDCANAFRAAMDSGGVASLDDCNDCEDCIATIVCKVGFGSTKCDDYRERTRQRDKKIRQQIEEERVADKTW